MLRKPADICETKISMQCPDKLKEKWKVNKKTLFICLIVTFIWGLIAHSYGFFSGAFSHDSLNEFNALNGIYSWKIQLGRVIVPLYRMIFRGALTMPWLIGLLSLFFIGLTVFLITKIFRIRSVWMIVIIAGIFTVNQTVTATAATYIGDLDSNMMALLLSVFAVYLWQRFRFGWLAGIIPVGLSMGLYQSYVSVTITLVLIYLILELLNSAGTAKTVFIEGIEAVAMLIGGGILYIILMKAVCFVTGISILSGAYNSVDTFTTLSFGELIYYAFRAYLESCYNILAPISLYSYKLVIALHIIMILIGAYFVIRKWIHIEWKEKLLTVVLILLLPLGMNVAYVLAGGMGHDIMYYAMWLTYLLVILLAQSNFKDHAIITGKEARRYIHSGLAVISVCLVCISLWSNVQVANAVYLKKDLEAEASLSLFTRIVYQMEQVEGYVPGETPVVFVGDPDEQIEEGWGYGRISELTGASYTSVLGAALRTYYQRYFDYVLMNPAVMADAETWDEITANEIVADMPSYPESGSIQLIDGVLVVKLSESD